MTDYWFKPKTHGYGASPTNWKGWALTIGFVVLSSLIAGVFIVVPVLSGNTPTPWHLIGFSVTLALAVWGLFKITQAKTDGEWKWRWGDKLR